jgi:hypothetical protein
LIDQRVSKLKQKIDGGQANGIFLGDFFAKHEMINES